MMLPQDALTSVESKIGKGLVVLSPGGAADFRFSFAMGEFGVVDIDDGEAVFAFRGDGQGVVLEGDIQILLLESR